MEAWCAAITFFLCLQCLALAVRLCIRRYLVASGIWHDDIVASVALVFSSGFSIVCLCISPLILSKSIPQMSYEEIIRTMNLILAAVLLYLIATILMKFALGLLILRVIPNDPGRPAKQRRGIFITLTASTLAGIAGCLFTLLECGGPQFFATNLPVQKGCLPLRTIDAVGYTHAIVVALTDLSIGYIAVDFVRGAPSGNRKSKITSCVLLAFGSFGCLASIARIPFINSLTGRGKHAFLNLESLAVLSAAELSIGLTCTSLACYRPLLARLFPYVFTMMRPPSCAFQSGPALYTPPPGPSTITSAVTSRVQSRVPSRLGGLLGKAKEESVDEDEDEEKGNRESEKGKELDSRLDPGAVTVKFDVPFEKPFRQQRVSASGPGSKSEPGSGSRSSVNGREASVAHVV